MLEKLKYVESRWSLKNIDVIYQYAKRAVFSAESETLGPVIIKMNDHHSVLKTEYEMLKKLNGEQSCKVYDFEEEKGILVEEWIVPGSVLREEKSLEKRIRAFHQVFRKIHSPAEDGETYLNWLENICKFCNENPVSEEIIKKARLAHSFCGELFEKYPERVLLHGDLHHDNLLLSEDGSYVMIDPKGVIGPTILDLPRYIMNEIHEDLIIGNAEEHIENVIRLISEECSYDREDVSKAVFMEIILGNVWCIEDGEEIDEEQMAVAEHILLKIYGVPDRGEV